MTRLSRPHLRVFARVAAATPLAAAVLAAATCTPAAPPAASAGTCRGSVGATAVEGVVDGASEYHVSDRRTYTVELRCGALHLQGKFSGQVLTAWQDVLPIGTPPPICRDEPGVDAGAPGDAGTTEEPADAGTGADAGPATDAGTEEHEPADGGASDGAGPDGRGAAAPADGWSAGACGETCWPVSRPRPLISVIEWQVAAPAGAPALGCGTLAFRESPLDRMRAEVVMGFQDGSRLTLDLDLRKAVELQPKNGTVPPQDYDWD